MEIYRTVLQNVDRYVEGCKLVDVLNVLPKRAHLQKGMTWDFMEKQAGEGREGERETQLSQFSRWAPPSPHAKRSSFMEVKSAIFQHTRHGAEVILDISSQVWKTPSKTRKGVL